VVPRNHICAASIPATAPSGSAGVVGRFRGIVCELGALALGYLNDDRSEAHPYKHLSALAISGS